jgi:hypothetical protein
MKRKDRKRMRRLLLKQAEVAKTLAEIGSSDEGDDGDDQEIVEYCRWMSKVVGEELSEMRIRELLKQGEQWAESLAGGQHSLPPPGDPRKMPGD